MIPLDSKPFFKILETVSAEWKDKALLLWKKWVISDVGVA
jgi:hypothetical protein